ncbi:MAG: hypothetical protein QG594_667, partial [Bacteroidota bacterium]|nr:hypothetical protein [Bacteroidota bacterium]
LNMDEKTLYYLKSISDQILVEQFMQERRAGKIIVKAESLLDFLNKTADPDVTMIITDTYFTSKMDASDFDFLERAHNRESKIVVIATSLDEKSEQDSELYKLSIKMPYIETLLF